MVSILDSESRLRELCAQQGQEHVFRFWDQLDDAQREQLLTELDALDFEEVTRLIAQHIKGQGAEQPLPHLEPAPFVRLPRTPEETEELRQARQRGEEVIRAGQVAAFLVAGGQGTRLGYDGPKGSFPIGALSSKTFFQLFAEQILATRRRYAAETPWYIMTSRDNDTVTRRFFATHNFFGLPAKDVIFLQQGQMPAIDQDGKLLMESPHALALAPDGHGGAIRALKRSGALADMAKRGVKYISHFQVDNVLIRIIDPDFLGYHALSGSQMSSRMVRKRSPDERVGVFCLVDGRLRVIEYSDLPADLAAARRPDGELQFTGGNIAIHIYDVDFVEQLNQRDYELPFHRAWKKVPFVNELSHRIRPRQPNANKFEMFVFDTLPAARKTLVMEVAREDEFSPVKSLTGEDSVESAQRDQMRLAARWCRAAGVEVETDPAGTPRYKIEISPLFAACQEEFIEKMKAAGLKAISRDTYFE